MTDQLQETETEQQETTTDAGGASRDDLLAAVREAGGTASVDIAAEEAAARAAGVAVEPAVPPAGDPDEPPILAKLKAREADYGKRRDAEDYATTLKQKAEAEAQRLIDEARARAEKEWQAEMEARRKRFAESPTAALRELGKPQEIVDAVLAEDSPHAREIRELRQEVRETREKSAGSDEIKAQLEAIKNGIQAEKQAEQLAQIRKDFLSQADAEKAPFLNARYDENEIFQKANTLGLDWKARGMVIGKDFDYSDLVTYLEHDARKRISGAGFARVPQQVSGAPATAATAATEPAGKRPQGLANGSRTLSAATGSERRTSPRPLNELSRDEARAALIEEVAAARRANPDAKL